MTIIDGIHAQLWPEEVKVQLYEALPDAKQALIKNAGEFSYVTHADEVTMHLQVGSCLLIASRQS